MNSIMKKLFILDDETIVFPGHGDKTTIGNKRREISWP
jgi:glyoxylase-like metal-dependent hydrolase (beta-lactamase superfamily II)